MSEIAKSLDQAERDRNTSQRLIKLIILTALSWLAISMVWWLTGQALYGHQPFITWLWVGLAAMLWTSLAAYFAIVNPFRWMYPVFSLVSFGLYVALLPHDLYVLIGGALFFALSLLFAMRIAQDEKNQLHFSIRRTVSSSVLLATYGFMFVIGFNVYHYSGQDFKQNPEKYYGKVTSTAVRSVPFVTENFSGVDLNQPLDEYLFQKSQSQLPEDVQQSPILSQSAYQQYRDQFLRQFNLSTSQNETVASAITKIIDQKTEEVLSRYAKFLPLVFALAVFGLLRTFAFIFNWITIFFSWLLFRLLLSLRFFRIGKATVEVDRLEI